jgi:hypothetical protein
LGVIILVNRAVISVCVCVSVTVCSVCVSVYPLPVLALVHQSMYVELGEKDRRIINIQ